MPCDPQPAIVGLNPPSRRCSVRLVAGHVALKVRVPRKGPAVQPVRAGRQQRKRFGSLCRGQPGSSRRPGERGWDVVEAGCAAVLLLTRFIRFTRLFGRSQRPGRRSQPWHPRREAGAGDAAVLHGIPAGPGRISRRRRRVFPTVSCSTG